MEIKDVITLVLSFTAIVLSVLSTIASQRVKSAETKRDIRNQMVDLIAELVEETNELRKMWSQAVDKREDSFYSILSSKGQKISTLARQAVYLVNQDESLVNDVEYATIAQALVYASDFPEADRFWQKALKASPSDFYKVINLRGYADFLFGQGKSQQGREQYHKALAILDSNTDFNRVTNAYTYHMLMVSEANILQYEEADRAYKQARGLLASVGNSSYSKEWVNSLEQSRLRVMPKTSS